MFINQRTLSLTLIASLLLVLTLVEAHEFNPPLRRDHAGLKLVKKKRAGSLLDGIANFAGDPLTAAENSTASASASASASAQSSASASNSASASSASQSASLSASSPSVSSISSASQSATSTTPTSADTSKQTTPPPADNTPTSPVAHSVSTITQTNAVVQGVQTDVPSQQSATAKKNTTITTTLIVVAAAVGGLAILWTVFRKWKLGASKRFEARMDRDAPINWGPTDNDDGAIPTHRLARTDSRASSTHNSSQHGHAAGGYNNMDHDFTAGNANLAPVGGYADLTRGPSPQPQMQESMNHGPSINRSYGAAYNNGVPLHHQGGAYPPEAYDYNGEAIRF